MFKIRWPLKIQYQKAHSECTSNSHKMFKRSSQMHLFLQKRNLLSLMNSGGWWSFLQGGAKTPL